MGSIELFKQPLSAEDIISGSIKKKYPWLSTR
jgi:hypothetical protein